MKTFAVTEQFQSPPPPPPFLPPSFTGDDHVSHDGLVSHGASEGFLWWPVGSGAEAGEGDARHATRVDSPAAALAAQQHIGVRSLQTVLVTAIARCSESTAYTCN